MSVSCTEFVALASHEIKAIHGVVAVNTVYVDEKEFNARGSGRCALKSWLKFGFVAGLMSASKN